MINNLSAKCRQNISFTEAMKRDAVLQRALSESGMELRFHAFFKGADVNFFLKRGDLEVAIGGDMPALTAVATLDVTISTFVQYGFSSIVAKRHMLMPELKGKRIGYPFGSNAHFALLNSLSAIDLSKDDVNLIPLDVTEIPAALDPAKGNDQERSYKERLSTLLRGRREL